MIKCWFVQFQLLTGLDTELNCMCVSYFKGMGILNQLTLAKNAVIYHERQLFKMWFALWMYLSYTCIKRETQSCLVMQYCPLDLSVLLIWSYNRSSPNNKYSSSCLAFLFLMCISTRTGSLVGFDKCSSPQCKVQAPSLRFLRCILFILFCLWSFTAGNDWEVILWEG